MPKASEPDIREWAEQGRRTIIDVADMLGVPPETYTHDPMSLIPALQDWVSRAPLDEFEQSDWVTLHADLMCYLADFLIQKYGARWQVEDDSATHRGHRYVIEATGIDGRTRRIDPAEIVRMEFAALPIEIVRMLATAERELHLASQPGEGE
ncbi:MULTISPECIES: hypothetical protein [Streptomyces]|uniref:hypothetical protein n=1 Tax=Streptomyces TaxID=1883 RepID=UPI001678F468|nr:MULTISPECIES: hypothetical protein [Streptomyces]MBK3522877.1 hypothetical protein [Streptomyces sp. MBT70]GGS12012.1 hypothetical protein GCM10010236_78210 [Streptomyces eurythermus]